MFIKQGPNKKSKKPYILKVLLYSLIMAFFVCVVFIYYRRLYTETRQRVIDEGKSIAEESAYYIDTRLNAGETILLLAAHSVNNMMENGFSNEEIYDFLAKQTDSIRETLVKDSTGFYGYINGEFMDGSGWVPEPGYDPMNRPWYIQGLEKKGEIAYVGPYLDMNTGNMMIGIDIALSDGVSVMGTDTPIMDMQRNIEKLAEDEDLYSDFLVNELGVVIAHSLPEYIGSNIYDSDRALFKSAAEIIKTNGSGYFFENSEGRRLVYVVPLDNGWSCVTVIDATEKYNALHRPLIYTVIVLILTIAIYGFVLYRVDKKNREIEELSAKAKVAEAENMAKTAFLSNVSHELRTPLNAILGMNELIHRKTEKIEILSYTKKIKASSEKLLHIINEMLDFSKKEVGIEDFSFDIKEPEPEEIKTDPAENFEIKYEMYRGGFTAPDAKILAVDDNSMNLIVFESLVRHTLMEIDTALSGDECIRLSRKKKYDIIYMDHMMPGKDGIETLKEIRADKYNPNVETPVVCITANAVSGVRDSYIEAGFIEYLTKPVNPDELEATIIKYLPDELLNEASGTLHEEDDSAKFCEDLNKMLANVPGDMIDSEAGIKNSGSVKSYISLLKVFYNTINDKVSELDSYIENGDYENYTIKVHALKSSARIIGAAGLGEEAQALENAGKSGDIDYIKANHEAFIGEYLGFGAILSKAFPEEKEDDKRKPEADAELMDIVYMEIKSAAQDMNCGRLEEIFKKMGEYRIPEEEKEVFSKIKTASDNYDYDKIIECLTEA
jgi:CheY-like chemotaxis protein